MVIINHTPYHTNKDKKYTEKYADILRFELESQDTFLGLCFMMLESTGVNKSELIGAIQTEGETLKDRVRDGKARLFDKVVELIKEKQIDI